MTSGVPGSNLLEDAFEAIETMEVLVSHQGERVKNAVGQYITPFEPPVAFEGSVQAVNRSAYQQLGLDFSKKYVTIYLCADVHSFTRNTSGDRITVGTKNFEIVSDLDWFEIDGWVGLLCVQLVLPI